MKFLAINFNSSTIQFKRKKVKKRIDFKISIEMCLFSIEMGVPWDGRFITTKHQLTKIEIGFEFSVYVVRTSIGLFVSFSLLIWFSDSFLNSLVKQKKHT